MKRSQLSGSDKRKLSAAKQKAMIENRPTAVTTFFCTPVQPAMSRPAASQRACRVNEEGCDSVDKMGDFNAGAEEEVRNPSTLPITAISHSSADTCIHTEEDYPYVNARNEENSAIKQNTG